MIELEREQIEKILRLLRRIETPDLETTITISFLEYKLEGGE